MHASQSRPGGPGVISHERTARDESPVAGAGQGPIMAALEVIVSAADDIRNDLPASLLTERQREVAALIAEGLTNQDIADRLCVERHVVSNHVAQILWRLAATDRIQVANWAVRHRLFGPRA